LQRLADFAQLAEKSLAYCGTIARFSEASDNVTRTFLSEPMRACHDAISTWMRELGMQITLDSAGNLRGLRSSGSNAHRLLIGSHLDTVPNAGAYDGVLGVCLALAVCEAVREVDLPFAIEIFGFSEEEGVRFRTPFLGSRAVVGNFDPSLLDLLDSSGRTLAQTIEHFGLSPEDIPKSQIDTGAFAYLEFHVEQGPVLEHLGGSIAAVQAIAGQSRLELVFNGRANHAGTTPMELRRDALIAAAEWIVFVEQYACSMEGLVATVGKLRVLPDAVNVIPAEACASLDVRHQFDETRERAIRELCSGATHIASRRGVAVSFREHLSQGAVAMDKHLVDLIEQAMLQIGEAPRRMVSGAGHDAMIMAKRMPSAMVFIRSIGGISHHPDEAVYAQDVAKAIQVGTKVVLALADQRKT
jgi:allantoate deiminase